MQLYGKLAEAPGVARGIKNALGKLYSNSEKIVEFWRKGEFFSPFDPAVWTANI